jgi:hypothetical protein
MLHDPDAIARHAHARHERLLQESAHDRVGRAAFERPTGWPWSARSRLATTRRFLAAASGPALILGLSSGLASGWGATVERFATSGISPETSLARPVPPFEVNLLDSEPADPSIGGIACDRSSCSGIEQWLDAGAPIPTTEVGPNERRLFGR